jgi:DNA-binding MarR family transcriptional regulator
MDEQSDNPVPVQPLATLDKVIHAPARLSILAYLYVAESVDAVLLKNLTELSWGSLSMHLNKLEDAGYVTLEKGYKGKKPQTVIYLSERGRNEFREYKQNLQQILNDLPE